MPAPRLNYLFLSLSVAALATFFGWAGQNALSSLRYKFYDVGLTLRAPQKPPDMVILGIDERFMAGRHAYLAPRDRLATLIFNVAAAKPRAIALDVWLDSRIDDRQNGDLKLKTALQFAKKRGVPVVLSDVPPAQTEFGLDSRSGQTARGGVIPYFADEARTGSVLFVPDGDGAIRSHPAETPDSPSFAFQVAWLSGGRPRRNLEPAPLNFCGPPGTVDTQSAADFLQPDLAPLLEGKIVFIGATYLRSSDFQRTPYSNTSDVKPMYGVEILAQATDSLRRGAPLRSNSNRAAILAVLLVFAASFFVAWLTLHGNLLGTFAALGVLCLAVLAAIFSARHGGPGWGFRYQDATPFLLSTLFAVVSATGWRSWKTARELRLVRDTFGAYVGEEVLQSLSGKMPELGGETRPIAVLFCDIRGYSALAESMESDPKALLGELNAHFAPLVGALKKHGAYVDNYVGDLVMALFGAPVSAGDFAKDVRAATLAALEFVEIVEARNQKRLENGQFPIEIGIGVHCGVAVVGNLGSRDSQGGGKIHYTAIGDVVNVASRVESATRGQNVALLVTREVVEIGGQLPDAPPWCRIGEISVKGRSAPVEIFKMG